MNNNKSSHNVGFNLLIPIVLGTLAFYYIIGLKPLNVTNISWLQSPDAIQHYLGWMFFRNSDWTFPLGSNPKYGLDFASSIVFSDVNPLLAFLFKPFSSILPNQFQYTGIWILICFILQSWFGWKISNLISKDLISKIFFTTLLVFSPPMINRFTGHDTLASHFFILASLYLALNHKKQYPYSYWLALLLGSVLVHAYIFFMVGFIWFGSMLQQVYTKRLSYKKIFSLISVSILLVALFAWQAGYFWKVSVEPGFGLLRLNLLALFDSFGWSYILKSLPHTWGDYEGFNYLGLGWIFLLIFATFVVRKHLRNIRQLISNHRFLFCVLIFLTVFSLSNSIAFGSHELFSYHIPGFIRPKIAFLRASGRMFWPVYYMICISIFYIIAKSYKIKVVQSLVGIGTLLQIFDTKAGWYPKKILCSQEQSPAFKTALQDPFWHFAASQYSNIQIYSYQADWEAKKPIAYYAGKNKMGTNAVYVARFNHNSAIESDKKIQHAFQNSSYDSQSLYVIDKAAFEQFNVKINEQKDYFGFLDGYYVVAPNWYQKTNQ